MNIFIGWSHSSEGYGKALKAYFLQCFLDRITVYISGDIPPGEKWKENLEQELRASDIGVFCVTDDSSPEWICYEAGVISACGKTVVPLLFDTKSNSLFSPLSQYQAKEFDEKSIKQLAVMVYNGGGKKNVGWEEFEPAREEAWKHFTKAVQDVRAARKYTLDRFMEDVNKLEKGRGEKDYWLYRRGIDLAKNLKEMNPVKDKWNKIEKFRQDLIEHGDNNPDCTRILQNIDGLIDG